MKPDFIKTYGQRMIFCIIVSTAITLCVLGGSFALIGFLENYLRKSGYRSVMLGPDGIRMSSKAVMLVGIAVLTFTGTFYLQIRSSIRYINEIIAGVRAISEGDLDHSIEVKGNDEFSVMALNLNVMQKNIKTLMERERIAEHTKNDLVSSVAHDLRTPLTSIIGYLGWVRERRDLDDAVRAQYIDIAYEKALRLEQLTNELFGFVKLEHNELKIQLCQLDLVQLIEQMLDEMTPSFVENELNVVFLPNPDTIPISADGELLARLFGNLLNNAVKYGKEGKQIRITAGITGEYAVVRVINYGRVIPKEELGHIFQKFYRAEQSRSRNTGGTGLGLAIVKQIVELHQGKIQVKSDLQGTVFEVELPLMQKGGERV